MSVVEIPVIAPVEQLTEREQRARTLEAAALEMEFRGRCRGTLRDLQGRVCLVGAIGEAVGGNPSLGWYNHAEEVWGSPNVWADDLFGFNDSYTITDEETMFFLRWRAEEIRDGWDA